MLGYYILLGGIALVSWFVSNTLKKKFAKYSKVHLRNGLSGAEIAEKMLADHGITDVEVISTLSSVLSDESVSSPPPSGADSVDSFVSSNP